jgi:RNA polymerase sigma-70 factor (ECF subfamily)
MSAPSEQLRAPVASVALGVLPEVAPDFGQVYRELFGFVWRSARGFGVTAAAVDDVVQEIFVVVHRRLPDFEGRSSLRTWVSGIVLNVVRHHRRHVARKNPPRDATGELLEPDQQASPDPDPFEGALQAENARKLQRLLDTLDDDKREVLVLAELEELSIPEIAEALGINVNTAYSRLRLARERFELALKREQAREQRRRA